MCFTEIKEGELTFLSIVKVSATDHSRLIYLPKRLLKLLPLQKSERLDVIADVANQQTILQRLGFGEMMGNKDREVSYVGSIKISATNGSRLVYLPKRLVELLKLRKGEYLQILVDVASQRFVLRRTGFGGSQEVEE